MEPLLEMPRPGTPVTQRKGAVQSQWLRSLVIEKPQAKVRGAGGVFE